MRRFLATLAVLALAACAGLGPRAQLAAADKSLQVAVDRLDTSCVAKQIPAARCVDAQGYVRTARTALDTAYQTVSAGGDSTDYLAVVVSVTAALEAILAEQKQ